MKKWPHDLCLHSVVFLQRGAPDGLLGLKAAFFVAVCLHLSADSIALALQQQHVLASNVSRSTICSFSVFVRNTARQDRNCAHGP